MKQSGRRGDECHSVIVNEEGKDGKNDADNFLRPWESTERVDAQCLDGWLGRYRKKPSAPSCRALGLRSLVLVGDVGDRDGGFPRELYEIQYPAPGDPELASRVRDLLAPVSVGLDQRWGLDHGTWSVLC